jgi:hypothetical protein
MSNLLQAFRAVLSGGNDQQTVVPMEHDGAELSARFFLTATTCYERVLALEVNNYWVLSPCYVAKACPRR